MNLMLLREMFVKDINRDIKGVIKVGQANEENVAQELDEYVVTNELLRHIRDFYVAYQKGITGHTDNMGVWISGFFGSGKSHFLKILSYLLDNKAVMIDNEMKKAIDFFREKINDPMVLANMKQASDVTTDVVLFNVDAKSESDSKNQKDAIVKVFNKVFNEMQGFCGSIPWVAELERQMVKDDTYTNFKAKFKELSGVTWEEARYDIYYEEDSVVGALAATTKMSEESARNWYNKAEENYSLSVERFAQKVREYVESKGRNHHVIFLVDEIGQYIGDNSQLMLNLQTVVEQLGVQCGGKVWVIVTSQQDIDSVTKVKGNDFSRVTGRFNTRLSLSSANVDEVIKKRILEKNDVAKETLTLLYKQKSSILKNLITFSTNTAEMKMYKDEEDFVDIYPFLPYQFNLLQHVFNGIRTHGASGKSLSEGERSLLAAFQETAVKYANTEAGALIPAASFFDTVESFLDSSIRAVIIHAENNERLNTEDIQVLKLLFLIKYVKELPSNLENIATLMVRHVDQDKIELKKELEKSLTRLVKETLVQKNGDDYIFLTNDEQDVNREIKNMSIDSGELIQKIGEVIFEEIYADKKYRYSKRYNFPFNSIIDDRTRGTQNNEIGLKILTPYYDNGTDLNTSELRAMSTREKNVIVHLPDDTSYLEEMEEIMKIHAYLKQKGGSVSSQTIEDIKTRKSREVSERKGRLKTQVTEAIRSSNIYVNGTLLPWKDRNPGEKINDGFKILIDSLYSNLNHIKEFIDNTRDLQLLLDNSSVQMSLDVSKDEPNILAHQDVNAFITRAFERKQQLTVKMITTQFSKEPFGWNEIDIVGIIIKLLKAQDIRVELSSETIALTDKNMLNYLTKRDFVDRVRVNKRIMTPPVLITKVKNVAKDVFGISSLPNDEDGIMNKFKELSRDEKSAIELLLTNYSRRYYPGQKVLEDGIELFKVIISVKDATTFYNKVKEMEEDFLDYGEDVGVIKDFFKDQRKVYDDAASKIDLFDKSQTYVTDQEAIKVINDIKSILKKAEPYSDIHKLPNLVTKFNDKYVELLEKESEPVRSVIKSDFEKVKEELNKYEFKDKLWGRVQEAFTGLLTRLDCANEFADVISMKVESDRIKTVFFNEISTEIERMKPSVVVPPIVDTPSKTGSTPTVKVKKTKNVSMQNLLPETKEIKTKEDIEDVVELIRQKLENEWNEDTIIKLI
ncbi:MULTISPECIES: BREX system P-loop protein BrxC [unclassified Bacillus cereus group]|uniref:BREX system P-loop protein BrxC n=1 Tax=unclassified Bacillus cereus group TaxID=2750818 RepID=UPI0022E076A7|nr:MULTISPECIES: BREX system P-loop protein BrxC [unclassified Bacillus cereus group]MDA2145829.1 BREX system P-loop protein BrxC [Bacillus cereus group sp. Bc248]MDA2173679.1 BREX system P-loop protein BrxC [Bacillus cereus group sp. Bc247]